MIRADVTKRDEIVNMFNEVEQHFGKIDILVNNAGINKRGWFEDITEEDWEFEVGNALKGYLFCSQKVASEMIKRKNPGRIISISSIHSLVAADNNAVYGICKAGVNRMTMSMAKELENKAAFIPGPKEFSRGGGKSMANIFSNLSESESKQYLEQIQSDNPELYAEIKKYYISFDDLINTLPEGIAAEFWSNPDLDVDLMAKALKGYEKEIVDKVIEYLPQKKQAMFSPIETPVAKREVELARSQILGIAKEKVSSGEWNLEDIFGEGEFIE